MKPILGYVFTLLALGSIAFNCYLNYLVWRRDYGSSPMPLATALFGTSAFAFFSEKGVLTGGIGIIFIGLFILDIIFGGITWHICRLLKVPQEVDWKDAWDISLSFAGGDNDDSELPEKIMIVISNKGGKKVEGGNFHLNFFKDEELYCFGFIQDFSFPFDKKLKLTSGEKVSQEAYFKGMRFVGLDGKTLDVLELKEKFGKSNLKIVATISDHFASRRIIKSNELIFELLPLQATP